MSTEALRGTSRHQFLGRRNELSGRLEMDCRKGQNGYGRRLRHQTGCDPSGSNLYRRSHRLGSVTRGTPTLTTLALRERPLICGRLLLTAARDVRLWPFATFRCAAKP